MRILAATLPVCAVLAACTQQAPMQASGWAPASNAAQTPAQAFAECRDEADTARFVMRSSSTAPQPKAQAPMTRPELIGSCMRVRGFVPG